MSEENDVDQPLDATDLVLLDGLDRVLRQVDPVPDGLVERSLFALTLEGLRAEVMELRRLDTPALAVRGTSDALEGESVEAQTITFTADSITVMITLSVAPSGGVRIDGWSAPATRFLVDLYRPDGRVSTESDDDGGFVVADVPPGPASLVLRRADGAGPAVSTPVIEL